MQDDAGRKGTRRVVGLLLASMALAITVGVACSSSSGGGGGGGGNNVDLSPAVRAGLLSSLGSLSASLTAGGSKQGALAAQAAALALEAGSQVTNVDATFTAALGAGPSGEAATGSAQALAFVVHVANFPGNPSLQINGSLVFQGTTQLQVAGAVGSAAPFPTAVGLLANSLTQVWLATSGQESSQLQSSGSGTCASAVLDFPGVSSCVQGGSANAGYTVTASAPAGIAGNTASGSATASLTTQALEVVELTYDCNTASPNLCTLIAGGGGGGGGDGGVCHTGTCRVQLSGAATADFGYGTDAGTCIGGYGLTQGDTTLFVLNSSAPTPGVAFLYGTFTVAGNPSVGAATCTPSVNGSHPCSVTIGTDGGTYGANGNDAGSVALDITAVVNNKYPDGGPSNFWCVDGTLTAVVPNVYAPTLAPINVDATLSFQ